MLPGQIKGVFATHSLGMRENRQWNKALEILNQFEEATRRTRHRDNRYDNVNVNRKSVADGECRLNKIILAIPGWWGRDGTPSDGRDVEEVEEEEEEED